jgi:hypothetical protein
MNKKDPEKKKNLYYEKGKLYILEEKFLLLTIVHWIASRVTFSIGSPIMSLLSCERAWQLASIIGNIIKSDMDFPRIRPSREVGRLYSPHESKNLFPTCHEGFFITHLLHSSNPSKNEITRCQSSRLIKAANIYFAS